MNQKDERALKDFVNTVPREKRVLNASPREKKLAYEFMSLAIDDCIAAKTLFSSELYALSVYHLQQAAEKANKSLLLYCGYIKVNDLKKISHYSSRAILKTVQKSEVYIPIYEQMNDQQINEKREMLAIKQIPAVPLDISSDDVLCYLIDVDIFMEREYNKCIEDIYGKDKMDDTIDRYYSMKRNWYDSRGRISALHRILSPHEWTTRYPDVDNVGFGPSNYTKTLGVVETLPVLLDNITWSIYQAEKIFLVYQLFDEYPDTEKMGSKEEKILLGKANDLARLFRHFSIPRDPPTKIIDEDSSVSDP